MYYDKQIRYIDYLENGEKQSNCGYVKITVMDNRLLLEMQIRGLYETDDVVSEVALEGAGTERRIGTVLVQQGSGSFRWEIKDSAHTGDQWRRAMFWTTGACACAVVPQKKSAVRVEGGGSQAAGCPAAV